MGLTVGLVGLPNVGKSTLFNALTKKGVDAKNYPFCTIDPSVGVVSVPDDRLDKLAEFSNTKEKIGAIIEVVDIAGLVEGASKGEGLGNQFLSHIREVDAILHMVRIFPLTGADGDITHVYGDIDPLRDIKVINMELILSDMASVEKRIASIHRDVKKGEKEAVAENDVLQKIKVALEEEKLANTCDLSDDEKKIAKGLHLLTMKKMLFGLNKRSDAENLDTSDTAKFQELLKHIEDTGSEYVLVDAKIEDDLKEMEGEEKDEFRSELGGDEDGISNLIRQCYKLLGLMTYFTTGEKETRAWTVQIGSSAPEAGRAIHNDFKDKFIRAQVIETQELLDAGSYANARSAGKVRTEGKDYIVKDGDVIEFLV